MHGYAAANTAAVCKEFRITPLEQKVLPLEFSNLQDMFIITKACLYVNHILCLSFQWCEKSDRIQMISNSGRQPVC